jgi:hypothetical protein
MEKIIKALNRLTTTRDDIAKHITGAMMSQWPVLIIFIVFGRTFGLIAGAVVVSLFILWEIYNMIYEKKPFSITDVLAAVVTVTPFLIAMMLTK